MGADLAEKVERSNETNDKDLVQLAGYHAYQMYEKPSLIKVNGKKFKVIDTKYNSGTGLDALTVKNVKTGEISIVYVGSQQIVGDWINTNINLIGDVDPAQLKAATSYFERSGYSINNKFLSSNAL